MSAAGKYRVPYEIVAPANPAEGNGRLVLEPPHRQGGPGSRDLWLTRPFLFGRGFSHAQVGWGIANLQMVDPEAEDVLIGSEADFETSSTTSAVCD